jgi:hypothetical protein
MDVTCFERSRLRYVVQRIRNVHVHLRYRYVVQPFYNVYAHSLCYVGNVHGDFPCDRFYNVSQRV